MQILPDTALNSICVHPKKGAGILRVNDTVQLVEGHKSSLPGWPTRLIQVEYPQSSQWEYTSENEEFEDILISNAPAIARS